MAWDKVFSSGSSRLVRSLLNPGSRLDVVRHGEHKTISFVQHEVISDMLERGIDLHCSRLPSCLYSVESTSIAVVAAPIALSRCRTSSVTVTLNLMGKGFSYPSNRLLLIPVQERRASTQSTTWDLSHPPFSGGKHHTRVVSS